MQQTTQSLVLPFASHVAPSTSEAEASAVKLFKDLLAESERRFRSVFDSGFQYVMLLDSEGHVLEINRAARRIFSLPDTMLGRAAAWDCLWWATHPGASERLRKAIHRAGSGSPVTYDDEFPAPDGSLGAPTVLEIAVSRMADAGGVADQFVIEARDVSRRRRTELANQEIDTLTTVGRVAAKVAHEINNPLAGIQYAFLLIKDAIPPSHPQHQYVGAIEREIARIAAVTRQLYETYQPEPAHGPVISLGNVIGDAISFSEQVNRNSGVQIKADTSGAPQLVRVPGGVLRQVLYNLIQNAMDASPPGATVHVVARLLGEQLEIRVSDSGPGVPVELRERIFEPFFSTKGRRPGARGMGLGLGLALVRRSVLSSGGQVRVESSATGGAEFIVTLRPQSEE